MGREIQAKAFVPKGFHQKRLGARTGDEIVAGQDCQAESCVGSDYQCLPDGLCTGLAAGQRHLGNSSIAALQKAPANLESFERPSAGHSPPNDQAESPRGRLHVFAKGLTSFSLLNVDMLVG